MTYVRTGQVLYIYVGELDLCQLKIFELRFLSPGMDTNIQHTQPCLPANWIHGAEL